MKMKYIVYITINQCNGKFYIGIHETNPEVFDGYIGCGIYRQNGATKDFPFHKAVRKYGYENFKRTTIQIFDTKEEARNFEALLVNSTLLKSKQCYNVAQGGMGTVDDSFCKRVYQFSLNGEFLRSYKSAREAAKNIDESNQDVIRVAIKNNCYGKTQSSYGYFWSFKKEFTYKQSKILHPIAQYTLFGKFIRTFNSITEAEVAFNTSHIYESLCKGKSAAGYLWRYYTGDTSDIQSYVSVFYKNKVLPIKMTNIKTQEQTIYNSVNECVEQNPNLKASQINRVLKKVINTHKGYTFSYVQDEDIVCVNQK